MFKDKSDKSYKKIKMIKSWAFVSNSSQYNVINFSKFMTVGKEFLIELCTLRTKNTHNALSPDPMEAADSFIGK